MGILKILQKKWKKKTENQSLSGKIGFDPPFQQQPFSKKSNDFPPKKKSGNPN